MPFHVSLPKQEPRYLTLSKPHSSISYISIVRAFLWEEKMSSYSLALDSKYKYTSEPPDDLKCLICLEVATEPWQHSKCGRLFCEECLDKHGWVKSCPHCRMEKPLYFEDSRSKFGGINNSSLYLIEAQGKTTNLCQYNNSSLYTSSRYSY